MAANNDGSSSPSPHLTRPTLHFSAGVAAPLPGAQVSPTSGSARRLNDIELQIPNLPAAGVGRPAPIHDTSSVTTPIGDVKKEAKRPSPSGGVGSGDDSDHLNIPMQPTKPAGYGRRTSLAQFRTGYLSYNVTFLSTQLFCYLN
jgi:hypothetical protein